MERDFKYYFDDKFISDYFNKRYEMNRLKNEVDDASKKIKDILLSNGMYYASTENYTVNIHKQHQSNDKFILLLKENNMANYIQEYCSVNIVDNIAHKLGVDPKEYKDIRCHVLKVNRKK